MKTETWILLAIVGYVVYQYYYNPQPGNPNFVGPVQPPGTYVALGN